MANEQIGNWQVQFRVAWRGDDRNLFHLPQFSQGALIIFARRGVRHADDKKPSAAVGKKSAGGMSQKIRPAIDCPGIAIALLKLNETCDGGGWFADWSLPRRTDKAGAGGAHSFDRFGFKGNFLHVNTWIQVLGHRSMVRIGG